MRKQNVIRTLASLFAVLASSSLFGEVTTGWIQTGAGPYDYNNADNWANGDINGIFSEDLALSADQTITFGHDTTLPAGLTLSCTGGKKLILKSADGNAYTLTLGGDLVNNSTGVIEPDASLNVDLGGVTRTFAATAGSILIHGVISNGGLVFEGEKDLRLYGANTFDGGLDVTATGYLYPRSSGALGLGAVTFEGGNKLNGESTITLGNHNPIVLKGDLYYTGDKSLNLGDGPVSILSPLTITVNKNTLSLGGALAEESPCFIAAITKAGGGALTTRAELVLQGETHISAAGTWYFNGPITGEGTLVIDGGSVELGSANDFVGNIDIRSGSLRPCASGAIPEDAKVLIRDGGVFRNYVSKGYGIARMINGGMIDPASSGSFGLAENEETVALDMSNYPNLVLAPNGDNRTFKGDLTPPKNGILRLGGGGKTLKLGSILPAGFDIEAVGSLQLDASQTDFDGTITVGKGFNLTIGSSVEMPKATLVMKGSVWGGKDNKYITGGVLTFAAKEAGEYVRAKNVLLRSSKLMVNVPEGGATTHVIAGTLSIGFKDNGGISQIENANTAANDSVLRVAELRGEKGVEVLNCSISATGAGAARVIVDSPELVGSGALGTPTAPVFPFVRIDNAIATHEPGVGIRALDASEYSLYSADYAGDVMAPGENMYIRGAVTVDLANSGVVNSLTLESDSVGHPTLNSAEGALTITSGAVSISSTTTGTSGPEINAPLAFGDRRGFFTGLESRYYRLMGAISGRSGVTISDMRQMTGTAGPVLGSAGNTFTGDVYVTCFYNPGSATFFPNAEVLEDGTLRTGDYYLFGKSSNRSIEERCNGLFGGGALDSVGSNHATVRMGCDGSNGDFSGSLGGGTGVNFHFAKDGSGRQRLSGTIRGKYEAIVSGELQIDGEFNMCARDSGNHLVINEGVLSGAGTVLSTANAGSIQIKSGSVLAPGSAEIPNEPLKLGKNVEMSDGASMRFFIGADRVSQALIAEGYGVTGAAEVIPVTIGNDFAGSGKWMLLEGDTFNEKRFVLDRSNGAGGRLSVATDEATGRAQLWYEQTTGLYIYLR